MGTADKIYENWLTCEDSDCKVCDGEFMAFTTWESIDPENLVGYCYDYSFSMDVQAVASTRKIGTFNEVRNINYNFDADADPEDARMYVKMMDDNSCIADGRPTDSTEQDNTEDNTEDHSGEDHSHSEDEAESGASALAASAVVTMA